MEDTPMGDPIGVTAAEAAAAATAATTTTTTATAATSTPRRIPSVAYSVPKPTTGGTRLGVPASTCE